MSVYISTCLLILINKLSGFIGCFFIRNPNFLQIVQQTNIHTGILSWLFKAFIDVGNIFQELYQTHLLIFLATLLNQEIIIGYLLLNIKRRFIHWFLINTLYQRKKWYICLLRYQHDLWLLQWMIVKIIFSWLFMSKTELYFAKIFKCIIARLLEGTARIRHHWTIFLFLF